ncbi:DUF4180 domain-containing protein [Actinopolyspora sp. H202]|uniref:DUF4180 domain-containing protein n=1 Tax=Actinopolyspora sp. H202 TaxID=1500456 RepID=UPI003EE581D6
MVDSLQQRHGVQVLMCDPAGQKVVTTEDVLDLIGWVFLGAELVAVPAERLDEQFFTLNTNFAGEVMQKFANYRLRLAVIGDISRHLEASSALRALVHESNAGSQVWFLPDIEALDARLSTTSARTP